MELIPLHKRDGSVVGYTKVDAEDAAQLGEHVWRLHPAGYACRYVGPSGRRAPLYLHRLLLGLVPGDGRQGDHVNRDRLDNRRANLRAVTIAQNRQNQRARGSTSRLRGVSWDARHGKWVAQACLNGRQQHLGRYADELEAAAVASAWRSEHMPFAVEA